MFLIVQKKQLTFVKTSSGGVKKFSTRFHHMIEVSKHIFGTISIARNKRHSHTTNGSIRYPGNVSLAAKVVELDLANAIAEQKLEKRK